MKKEAQNMLPLLPMRLFRTDFTEMQSESETRTILLLDGIQSRRRSNALVLEQLGHRLIAADDTHHALLLVDSQPVDLVIADLLVPSMGGPAFCQTIRASLDNSLLPVILITRRGHLEEDVSAMEAGADVVLPCAVHPRVLRAAVQSCLRRRAAVEALDETETVLFTLAQSVEERDPALGRHCERLALIAATMGAAMGLGRSDLLTLQRCGFLHDIGKVAIPDSVLFKPGPLNDEEWKIMKTHAERGERICCHVRSFAPVLPVIRNHHERWDGTGYPDGLKGEEIPLLARIVQFADIYDALTTTRPYKRAYTSADAISIMRQETAKGWRDPRLMQIFEGLVPAFSAPASADLSRLSLHALGAAIDRYRTDQTSVMSEAASDIQGPGAEMQTGLVGGV